MILVTRHCEFTQEDRKSDVKFKCSLGKNQGSASDLIDNSKKKKNSIKQVLLRNIKLSFSIIIPIYQLFTTQGTDILLSTITVRSRTHSHTHSPISPPGHLNTTTMGAIKSFFSRVFYGLITGAILGATFAILLGIVLGLTIGVILGVVLTLPLALLAAIILGLIAGASEGAVEFVANGLRNARDAILGLIDAGLSLLQGPKED